MAKTKITSMRDVVVAMRETGTGEQKLRFIAENLKNDSPAEIKRLASLTGGGTTPVLSDLTIAKLCDVLGVDVLAVLNERPRAANVLDVYVPPEVDLSAKAPQVAIETKPGA